MVYLITYDLNKTKDYEKLFAAIKALGDWDKDPTLTSVWFVSTTLSARTISDRLRAYMDSDDTLFITRLRLDEYSGWLKKTLWPWISARL